MALRKGGVRNVVAWEADTTDAQCTQFARHFYDIMATAGPTPHRDAFDSALRILELEPELENQPELPGVRGDDGGTSPALGAVCLLAEECEAECEAQGGSDQPVPSVKVSLAIERAEKPGIVAQKLVKSLQNLLGVEEAKFRLEGSETIEIEGEFEKDELTVHKVDKIERQLQNKYGDSMFFEREGSLVVRGPEEARPAQGRR